MDPLRHSALRALDDGRHLALVLELVDDDDALCASLVCTTFRSTIFRQPRHSVRGASEAHVGKRIITSVAAVASSSARLAWVKSLGGAAPAWVHAWDARTCRRLAAVGALEALQSARENGCEWDAGTCSRAAGGGHLGVLQWARDNGCEWDVWTCEYAAWGGHLDVLQWAHENGCEWDAGTCS